MSENEKLVERLRYYERLVDRPRLAEGLREAATALSAAQARIRELEEAIWLAHDQLNTYRSAAVEEVIDKLETYIPGLSGKEAPDV